MIICIIIIIYIDYVHVRTNLPIYNIQIIGENPVIEDAFWLPTEVIQGMILITVWRRITEIMFLFWTVHIR